MAWVITRLCSDCKDTACVEVCPVDCIYGLNTPDPNYRDQLFIEPEECIDCGACEPECPWGAIFEDAAVPEIFQEDTEINIKIFQDRERDDFTITPDRVKEDPTPDEVLENEKKWEYER